jgi:hypothetical protein
LCISIFFSFSSLSYDRSKASSKASSPHSAIQSFLFQMRVSSLLSLRSSNNFLRLLPRLPVTSIPPCIFPSVTRCRGQFLSKIWPIQFAFRLRISWRIFLCSLTLSNTSSFLTWSVQLIFSILLQHHISKLSNCFWSTARSVQVSAPYKAMLQTCNWFNTVTMHVPTLITTVVLLFIKLHFKTDT